MHQFITGLFSKSFSAHSVERALSKTFLSLVTLVAGVPILLASPPAEHRSDALLEWQQLVPNEGLEDPFTKLSREQLQKLAEVARIRDLLANEKVQAADPSVKQAIKTANVLRASGVDVDYHLMMRRSIRRMREAQGRAVVQRLDGVEVTLSGFVVPTQVTDGRVTEFFLVSDYDFCSYGISLPPNQVVLVRSDTDTLEEGAMLTATVTGRLTAKATKRTLLSKSGLRDIESAYTLLASDMKAQEVPLRSAGRRRDPPIKSARVDSN
jgi:hypothetical protein